MRVILLNNFRLLIITFFIINFLFTQNHSSLKATIKTAKHLEKIGDIESAISIYESILKSNSNHQQSIQSLKTIYLKYQMYDRGIIFIRKRLVQKPNDIRTYCELGELHFLNKQLKEANAIWYAGLKKFKHNRNYYRIMLSLLSKHNLDKEMSTILEKGRDNFGEAFLSYEAGIFYQTNNIYDKAIKEFILHLINGKNLNEIIERRILSMSDEEGASEIIENHLLTASKTNPNKILNTLSEFYFKQQKYSLSFKIKKQWTLAGNKDFHQWIKFANDLRNEGQYKHAINAYNFILGYKINSKLTERALLGLGQTFEDQIIKKNDKSLIPYFFDNNVFFEDPFQIYSSISNENLESSLDLYDSMLVSLTNSLYLSEAYFRLSEIQFRIIQDFDKSYYLLKKALSYKSNELNRQKIILRIADVFLAMGQTKNALEILKKESGTKGSEKIINKIILINFLTQNPDSSIQFINSSLSTINPKSPVFNDLMELKNVLTSYCKEEIDKPAFIHFQKSELFLRQNKLGNAIKELEFLNEKFSESRLIPITLLRLAILYYRLEDYDKSLEYALSLKTTEFADKGIILAGQIMENKKHEKKIALKYYMEIIDEFPYSVYYEPIRYHVRKIQRTKSS